MDGSELLGKLSDIKDVEISGETIQIGSIKFHPNRVAISRDADIEDWRKGGVFVQRTQQSNLWWLGDWAEAGEEKFGEEAAQYVSSNHFSEAYLRRARWVCSKIAPNRRIKELSFEHHAAVAGLKEPEQDRWLKRALDKELSVLDLRRSMRKQQHKKRYEEEDFPEGRFRVIYADPPWQYNDSGIIPGPTGGEAYGRAERHFPTMKLDDIKDLKVQDITARNCALFLWVPAAILPDAFEVISAWGFTHKNGYVWEKDSPTAGHYNAPVHEHLLIATRGKMTPDMDVAMKFRSVQHAPSPGEHSSKPELFREIIDTLYPVIRSGDRVELFARGNVPEAWRRWGNETETPTDGKSAAANDTPDQTADSIADTAGAAEATKGSRPRLNKDAKKKKAAEEEEAAVAEAVH
jgi:N6-adenosine-specific RNA methylase IME4